MATTQTLLWIALPNGVVAGDPTQLRISVFMNPRLRTDEGTTLALCPDFLSWPARMQPDQVTFTLEVDDGTQVVASVVSEQPDLGLWQALFGPDTPLRPYAFDDYANRPIVSFPVANVLNYVKDRYQTIASLAPFDLPLVGRDEDTGERRDVLDQVFYELVALYGQPLRVENDAALSRMLDESIEYARGIARQRRAAGERNGNLIEPLGMGAPGQPHDAFYRAMLFHYRPSNAEPDELPRDDAARARFEEQVDFHQMLSALGDFPQLLRRLGLIFDLQVPIDALPRTPDEGSLRKLRVVPTWTAELAASDYSPWTVYGYATLDDVELFSPISRFGESSAGLWTATSSADLVQVDVDGAALKTLNLASSLARITLSGAPRAIDAPRNDGVPTLRTGGISVVRHGHATHLNDTFNRSGQINAMLESVPPQLADLYAEDLIRGYRVDVLEGRTGQWRSLHQRVGIYAALNAPGSVPPIVDEGFTQASVTSPATPEAVPPDPGQELYAHESLFTWDGWSLSAPRPGKSISRTSRAPAPDEPETQPQRVTNTAMTRLGLETSFTVQEGTLPRLRFGQNYRVRVRVVDLAGNGPTLDEATALEAALPRLAARLPADDDLIYRRFEPINPPELAPRAPYTEGESLERLVVRSNFDVSADEYAVAQPGDQPVNERHVAPPKTSLQTVETHGLLDEAFDAKSSGLSPDEVRARVQAVYTLAAREAGALSAIQPEEQLELPYLPDPWAAGVVLIGLPGGGPNERLSIPFGGPAWHAALPFRIRLHDGDPASAWDEDARVLTVHLPKASIARVRVSSLFSASLDLFGLFQWLREGVDTGVISADQYAELEQGIIESRHWMFTPFRDLTLVHAVQQPLRSPAPRLDIDRWPGSTAAYLRGDISVDAPSTSKLDILASWSEPRDDPSRDAPEHIEARAHVMELPTALDGQPVRIDYPEAEDALRLEYDELLTFHTGKADYARREMQGDLDDPGANLTPKQRRTWQDQINLASKVAAHEFGDTKFRRVRYQVTATTRFREYFAPSITADPANLVRTSEEIEIDVLSSARPAAPRVMYAVPTFGWEQTAVDGTLVSTRRGGGVRVYLGRTWWSSGDGELLGVVLGASLPSRRDPLYRYSTFWGQDPLWLSPGLPLPRSTSFKNAVGVFRTVQLAELESQLVTVVGFDVHWDGERKLWYADLDLDTDTAYHPFVRLALVRYQPNSIVQHVELDPRPVVDLRASPVVLADFVQTAPNRVVTLTRDGGEAGLYDVAVSGMTYRAQRLVDGSVIAATSDLGVRLQRRRPDIDEETLAWTDLPVSAGLVPGAPDAQGIMVWQGRLSVPEEFQADQLRLLVQEFEQYSPATAPGVPAQSGGRRLVYVDALGLPN